MILFSDSGYMLHERAAEYVASGTGRLSLKTFHGGRVMYDAGSGTFAVDDQSYLVPNHGTHDVWIAFFRDGKGNLLAVMEETIRE